MHTKYSIFKAAGLVECSYYAVVSSPRKDKQTSCYRHLKLTVCAEQWLAFRSDLTEELLHEEFLKKKYGYNRREHISRSQTGAIVM